MGPPDPGTYMASALLGQHIWVLGPLANPKTEAQVEHGGCESDRGASHAKRGAVAGWAAVGWLVRGAGERGGGAG